MTKVIILGHGSYGTMIQENIKMLVGEIDGFYFIDFNITDDVNILKNKVSQIIDKIPTEPILFACDLTGGTPFREACLLASSNQNYIVVGGLNTAGYCEIAYNLHLSPNELAKLGVEVSKESIMIFPE